MVWEDGTPIDPGRIGLWKRYLNDFIESPKKIIFGAGVSALALGTPPHNTFINLIWQFGIIGIAILSVIFWTIFNNLFNKKSINFILVLSLTLFISFIESNVFNYVALTMIVFILISSKEIIHEGDGENGKSIGDNTSI